MKSPNEEHLSLADHGLRHLVAAFGGRMEFPYRSKSRSGTRAEDPARERGRAMRAAAARKDFERAWKTY
jgi:hypothetical protein